MLNIELISNTSTNNLTEIWKDFLKEIKRNVTLMTFNTWFLPLKPIEMNNSTIKVQLPSQFFWEWIDEHYKNLINKTIQNVLGEHISLTYVISEEIEQLQPLEEITKEIVPATKSYSSKQEFSSFLNPRYTFDNFIKGENNQLARAAATAISENPGGTSFNPLFIYGGVGLGKTHLMQAIGNKILDNFSDKRIIYLPSDIFTVQFVEAIKSDKVNEFSSFYRSMDALIIDDIQFLIGKEKTQDLFFHIFNTLHQARKQIVLSSDKAPKDLKGLDERLISRFQWGLSADIQSPDLETRIAILKKKSEDYGMVVSDDILEYIANSITSNIRELEGCLIKLLANSSLNSKDINLDLVKRTVKEIATDRKVNLSIDNITKAVCMALNVDENKLRDKTRKKEIVLARQLAMFFSKELTQSSLKTIGLHFGGRDHSTVIHSCNSIEKLKNEDNGIKQLVENLRNKIELI
jgi:chromosomal replication initiator protein